MPAFRKHSESPGPEAHPYKTKTLQRGTACFECRGRKLKCDAGKPTCNKCLRHNRICAYEDTTHWKGARRLKLEVTQLQQENDELWQTIAALEAAGSEQRVIPPTTYYPAYYAASDHLPNSPAIAGGSGTTQEASYLEQRAPPPPTTYYPHYPAPASDHLSDLPIIAGGSGVVQEASYFEQHYSAATSDHLFYLLSIAEGSGTTREASYLEQRAPSPTTYYPAAAASDYQLPYLPFIAAGDSDTRIDTDNMLQYLNIPPDSPVPTLPSVLESEETQRPATPSSEYSSLDSVLSSPAAAALRSGSHSPTDPTSNIELPATYCRVQSSENNRDALLNLFFAHAGAIQIGPTAEELTSRFDSGEEPHEALLQAIFLTACRFSSDPKIRRQEAKYRTRAQRAMECWEETTQGICDCIQASHLLAHHAYAMDTPGEADYRLVAATSFATTLINGSQVSTPRSSMYSPSEALCDEQADSRSSARITRPLSAPQKRALQQAYSFDRVMAAALGTNGTFPAHFGALPSEEELRLEREEDDRKKAARDAARSRSEACPRPQRAPMTPEQLSTLRARTSEKVWMVGQAKGLHRRSPLPGLAPAPEAEEPRAPLSGGDIHSELNAFRDKLPAVDPSDSTIPTPDLSLLSVYAQIHAAMLRASQGDSTPSEEVQDACSSVVGEVLGFICGLDDAEYKNLDPLMGMWWQWVVEYLLDELELKSHTELVCWRLSEAIRLVLIAMGKLAEEFPVALANIALIEGQCLRLGVAVL